MKRWLLVLGLVLLVVLVGLWWFPGGGSGAVFSDPGGLGTDLCEAGQTCPGPYDR